MLGNTDVASAQVINFRETRAPKTRESGDVWKSDLRESPKLPFTLMSEALEQSPTATSLTDHNGTIIYVNKAFTQLTGYALPEIVGEKEPLLSATSAPRHVQRKLWHAIADNSAWQGLLAKKHKNGDRYLVELTIAPVHSEEGRTTHYLCMHIDVTDAYFREQQINRRKTLVESVLNLTPMAMAVLDQQNRVVLDNQAYKALISDLRVAEPALPFLDLLKRQMGSAWEVARQAGAGFENQLLRFDLGARRVAKWYRCTGSWFEETDINVADDNETRTERYLLLTLSEINAGVT